MGETPEEAATRESRILKASDRIDTPEEMERLRQRALAEEGELNTSPVDHYAREAAANITGPPAPTAHGEFMKAQTAFIRAQRTFIHNKDLAGLLWAQLNYMEAMTTYLSTLDLPMVVGQQEDYIEHLHTVMEHKEVF